MANRVFNKITVVDEQDNVTGYMHLPEALAKGCIRRVAVALLFNEKDEILLQKRASWVMIHPNCWDFSAGGHVDEGSDYAETAEEELYEELGLKVTLVPVDTSLRHGDLFWGLFKGGMTSVTEIPYDSDEVAGVRWISIPEMEKEMKDKPQSFNPTFTTMWKLHRDKILAA